jgi:hypothetical protein
MSESIELQVARIVDREALVQVLQSHGLAPEPFENAGVIGVRVPCGDEADHGCEELLARLEPLVADLELPLVPVRADGFVFLHPPAD